MKAFCFLLACLACGVAGQCGNGCLKCSQENTCLLCDPQSGYYLLGNGCALSTHTNCLLLSKSNQCLFCGSGFYLDPNSMACLAIPVASKVNNCVSYNPNQACALCATGFYLKEGLCSQVTAAKENCQYYAFDGLCIVCKDGFVFSSTYDSCVAQPSGGNCQSFSYLQCDKCKANYYLNRNLLLSSLKEPAMTAAFLQQTVYSAFFGQKHWNALNFCERRVVDNCATYDDKGTCTLCSTEYFLKDGLCVKNPLGSIAFCSEYSNQSTCTTCQEGYYLTSNKCEAIETKVGCKQHASPANQKTPNCQLCGEAYVLKNGICETRNKSKASFLRCKMLDPAEEKCMKCLEGFEPNKQGDKCLPVLPNCGQPLDTAATDTAFKCERCNSGYFLDKSDSSNPFCVRGQIPFCETYADVSAQGSAQSCQTCMNGYYLKDNACLPHLSIPNCSNYDRANQNECSECLQGFYRVKLGTVCAQGGPVRHCARYDERGSLCLECAGGFYLNALGECRQILAEWNCLSVNRLGHCQSCHPNFVLKDGQCLPFFEHITANCQQYSSGTDTKDNPFEKEKCGLCSSPGYPFNARSFGLCVNPVLAHKLWQPYLIDRCERYLESGNKLTCLECEQGYYLDSTVTVPQCIKSCKESFKTSNLVLDNLDGKVNVCIDQTDLDPKLKKCTKLVRVSAINLNNNSLVIYRCLDVSSSFKVFKLFNTDFSVENGFAYSLGTSSTYPTTFSHFGLNLDTSIEDSALTVLSGCELYETTKKCIRCSFGQFLLASNNGGTVIQKCDSDGSSCDQSIAWQGLPPYLTAVVSCHVCSPNHSGGARIPTVKVTSTANKWTGFKNPSDGQGHALFGCAATADFGFDEKLANCAIGGLLDDAPTKQCLACKPGYFPSYSDNPTFKVTECKLIDNCETADNYLYNACRSCKKETNSKFYAATDHSLTVCKQALSDNCFILASANGDKNECEVCYPGFFPNNVGACEGLKLPHCNQSLPNAMGIDQLPTDTDENSQKKVKIYYMLSSLAKPGRCELCAKDFIKVQAATEIPVCVPSSIVGTEAAMATDASPIKHCKAYSGSSVVTQQTPNLKCVTCLSGKLPHENQERCIEASLNGCLRLNGDQATKCIACQSGFILDGDTCAAVSNCRQFDDGKTKCVDCNDGFFLAANEKSCSPGKIDNCKTYDKGFDSLCSACKDGFFLVKQGDRRFCFPVPASTNCLSADTQQVDQPPKFNCNKCSTGSSGSLALQSFFLANEYQNGPRSMCLPYKKVSNCLVHYNQNGQEQGQGHGLFKCNKCEQGYYRDSDFNCVKRTRASILNCMEYKDDDDECSKCASGFYYATASHTCNSFPTGIPNCAAYTTLATCAYCIEGFFLDANQQCQTTTSLTTITGCLIWETKDTCKKCKDTYFLKDNKNCVANTSTTAKGCVTFKSETECETCPAGSGIQDTSGTKSCVTITMPGNCMETTKIHPFNCVTCNSGYYLSGTKCEPATGINGCVSYDSQTTCTRCSETTYLAADRKTCLNFPTDKDSNCLAFKLTSEPTCQICANGYFFAADGKCTVCTANTKENGCAYCNPADNTKCLLCLKGYYMNSSGTCVKNIVTSTGIAEEFVPQPHGYFASALSMVVMWVGLASALLLE